MTMPWWGWLITVVVVFLLVAWSAIGVIVYRNYRKFKREMDEMDRVHDLRRRRP